jgi:tetratricopeptide (TPR) repeat protein
MRSGRRPAVLLFGVAALCVVLVAAAQLPGWSALGVGYTSRTEPYEPIVLDAYEILSGTAWARSTALRLTSDKTTDREKVEALVAWTNQNVRPQYAAPTEVISDNFYNIARRGFGYCDQVNHVFATLATFAGYQSRLLFLRDEDGVSPHTVAEVFLDGRWIVVDAWIGAVLHDEDGRLVSVADIQRRPRILALFGYDLIADLSADDFARGTPFVTFPYAPVTDVLSRLPSKVVGLRTTSLISSPQDVAAESVHRAPSDLSAAEVAEDVLTYDSARRMHLDGRYEDAIAGYLSVLRPPIDPDLGNASRFFLGVALLQAGNPALAIAAFSEALEADPATPWTRSALRYRGEARAQLGDTAGYVKDLGSAGTPRAIADLRSRGYPVPTMPIIKSGPARSP